MNSSDSADKGVLKKLIRCVCFAFRNRFQDHFINVDNNNDNNNNNNNMPRKVWYEITYPFPNFDGITVEFWELTLYDGYDYLHSSYLLSG